MGARLLKALKRSKGALSAAEIFGEQLQNAHDEDSLKRLWENFMSSWNKGRKFVLIAANEIEDQDTKKALSDALIEDKRLQYIFQSRNADEHSVDYALPFRQPVASVQPFGSSFASVEGFGKYQFYDNYVCTVNAEDIRTDGKLDYEKLWQIHRQAQTGSGIGQKIRDFSIVDGMITEDEPFPPDVQKHEAPGYLIFGEVKNRGVVYPAPEICSKKEDYAKNLVQAGLGWLRGAIERVELMANEI